MIDVLIAGAGPAGALAALRLARGGARVLLVDRARFPRDKLCGDTLNPGAMRILARHGLAAAIEAVSLPLDGMLVTSDRGVSVRGLYGQGQTARALTRRVLDAELVRAAVAAGVQFQDGVRVQGPLIESGPQGPRVYGATLTGRDGRPLRVPASMTIGADGRRSVFAIGLGLARQPAEPRRWAVGAYFERVGGLSRVGEVHGRRGHYIGVAPLGGGLANACLVLPRGPGFDDPAALLERHLAGDPLLAARFAGATRVTPPTVLGPLAVDASAAGMPGLLLAGDAAGFIDPMTGDGLRLALRGAELAAQMVESCLSASPGAAVDHAHERLATSRARELGRKLAVNRLLRRVTASASAVGAAGIGAYLAPLVLRHVIRYAGDVHTV